MSLNIDVAKGINLQDWINILVSLEKNDEKRMVFSLEKSGKSQSYHLYTQAEVKSVVDRNPHIRNMIAYGTQIRQFCAASGSFYFYKLSFEDMTTINELQIDVIRNTYLTPAHFKAVKDNFVKNIETYSFEALFNAEFANLNTIINAQLRMNTQAYKQQCCIKKIICCMQNLFIKLFGPSLALNSLLRYTLFIAFANIDCWNARYSLEDYRRARRAFAQGITGQFQEEITSLIGKDANVKQWIAQNHPDRNPDESIKGTYKKVDELRQLIDAMNKQIADIDSSSTLTSSVQPRLPDKEHEHSADTKPAAPPSGKKQQKHQNLGVDDATSQPD
ncbi:MAG: hypothetical protein JSS10_00130 [Verrucomicrobia bacterium]|nr:hypothetical protein [Verrucomicrobiota bacterium]